MYNKFFIISLVLITSITNIHTQACSQDFFLSLEKVVDKKGPAFNFNVSCTLTFLK